MENKQEIPQIRFKGFTDAWEHRVARATAIQESRMPS